MAAKRRHWKEKNGRFWARLAIPERLRPFFGGKSELLEPLGGDRRVADRNHTGAVARLQEKLADAERALQAASGGQPIDANLVTPAVPLTEDLAAQLIWDRYSNVLEVDTAKRSAMPTEAEIDAEREKVLKRVEAGELDPFGNAVGWINGYLDFNLTAGAASFYEGARRRRLASLNAALADNSTRPVDADIHQMFRQAGIVLTASSREWRDFGVKLMRAEIDALERTLERDSGRYSDVPHDPVVKRPETPARVSAPVSLRQLFQDYIAKKQAVGKHRDGGAAWRPVIESLIKFLKHDDAAKIQRKDLIAWRDHLLAAGKSPKTISDKYLAAVSAILRWAHDDELIPSNEAARVSQEVPKRVQSREKGYTETEAVRVLTACLRYQPSATGTKGIVRESPQVTAAKRWVPLICAFTGARVSEITQARKEDFRQEHDRWILRITPDAGTVKTSQYRDVPLHNQIEELGFFRFLEAAGPGPLFHGAQDKDRYLDAARTTAGRLSQWLNELDVVPDDVAPSHGWRHRFKTIGRQLGISDRVIDAIQDHAGRTAGDDYGDVTMLTKIRAIDQFPNYSLADDKSKPPLGAAADEPPEADKDSSPVAP